MNGLILIDKPKGWTSFDVVAKTRSLLKQSGAIKPKVGHAGTLDPLATGLLTILVGSYCKKAQEYTKLDKVYEVEMTLGATSTTDDAEGEISETLKGKMPSESKINEVINSFVGEIEQVPPAFSAIKINGKRAYKLAREGKEVKMEPRKVTIYSIDEVKIDSSVVRFVCMVSSGTYIRSLVRDIGEKLGCGAYMSNLRRTKVGEFDIKNAVLVEKISAQNISQRLTK